MGWWASETEESAAKREITRAGPPELRTNFFAVDSRFMAPYTSKINLHRKKSQKKEKPLHFKEFPSRSASGLGTDCKDGKNVLPNYHDLLG